MFEAPSLAAIATIGHAAAPFGWTALLLGLLYWAGRVSIEIFAITTSSPAKRAAALKIIEWHNRPRYLWKRNDGGSS